MVDESPDATDEERQERAAEKLRRAHFQMKLAAYQERIRLYQTAGDISTIVGFIPHRENQQQGIVAKQ
jgi:signal recognition particle GTPase